MNPLRGFGGAGDVGAGAAHDGAGGRPAEAGAEEVADHVGPVGSGSGSPADGVGDGVGAGGGASVATDGAVVEAVCELSSLPSAFDVTEALAGVSSARRVSDMSGTPGVRASSDPGSPPSG